MIKSNKDLNDNFFFILNIQNLEEYFNYIK